MQPRSRGFPFFLPIFKGQIVDRGQVEKQLNRKNLLNIFSVYQQAIELVVMLIVFDRISSFLSIHTGLLDGRGRDSQLASGPPCGGIVYCAYALPY